MSSRYILIVNSRKVTRPVFVIGAPHSGVAEVGTALKLSPGFHVTIGQSAVLQAVHAFARRPSLYQGRGTAALSVIRDGFASLAARADGLRAVHRAVQDGGRAHGRRAWPVCRGPRPGPVR